jgi:hypothetical protein
MNASTAAVLSAALALALASNEPTPTGSSSAGAAAVKDGGQAAKDPNRIVCRQETRVGSRFTKRVCRKASEWSARTETARQAFHEVQNRPVFKLGEGQ